MGRLLESIDYRKCKTGWSGPEYSVTLIENGNLEELLSNQELLGAVHIKRGIFQGDSLLPVLFVIIMVPLSLILRGTRAGYQLKKEGFNHLLFMSYLKLYGKNGNRIDSLVQTVWNYPEDTGIKFGIDIKCAVLELERGRLVTSEGI